MVSFRLGFALVALALATVPAYAQLADDRVPRERTIPLREGLRNELDRARILGPLRLLPLFQLSNFGYNSNVFGTPEEPESDFTASVGVGARYIVPMGTKFFLRGDLMPEYNYFHELEENRGWGGVYSASLLALGNRLSGELRASTSDRLQVVNSETERPAQQTLDAFAASTEIDVLPRVSLFGSWKMNEHSYEDEASDDFARFEELEREDTAVRGGVRYHVREFFDVSAAWEQTRSEFVIDPAGRDNETEAIILGLFYDRPRMYANVNIGQRTGRALDSTFPEYEEVTGSYFISYRLGAPVEINAFGNRGAVFSQFVSNPYFIEQRNGLALRFQTGDRIGWRLHGSTGSNDYPVPVLVGGDRIVSRVDDATALGAGMSLRLWRSIELVVDATSTEYDSNISNFDRDVFRVTTGLDFGGMFSR